MKQCHYNSQRGTRWSIWETPEIKNILKYLISENSVLESKLYFFKLVYILCLQSKCK